MDCESGYVIWLIETKVNYLTYQEYNTTRLAFRHQPIETVTLYRNRILGAFVLVLAEETTATLIADFIFG